MKIIIREEDSILLETEYNRLRAVISTTHEEKGLTIQLNNSYKYVLKLKNNLYKMFVLGADENIDKFDFGSYYDAKTVWQSF